MQAIVIVLLLLNLQHIFADRFASFGEFKKAAPKNRPTAEFDGILGITTPEFLKTKSFEEMKARLALRSKKSLPDFNARETTLKKLRAKLEKLRQTVSTMNHPSRAVLEDIKQTLAESIEPKLVPFELPQLPGPVEPTRFVENFGNELIKVHNNSETVHRDLFDSSRIARHYMVEQVYNVFGSLVFDLARGTKEMMRLRTEVKDVIIRDAALEADPECLEALSADFATINQYFGGELNHCARYAYYPARRYINTIFYPYLNYAISEINSLHYGVLSMLARSNVARDQESVLRVLDTVIRGDQARFEMFATEILHWEGNAFADAHINYVQTMKECGNDVISRHSIGNDFIMNQYNICLFRKKNNV